jgi:hypothetical protein
VLARRHLLPWNGTLAQSGAQHTLPGSFAGTAVASAYVEDIARFQAHRFVGGIAPIKGICRVSSAAAQLLSIPKQQLYAHSSGGERFGCSAISCTWGKSEDCHWHPIVRSLCQLHFHVHCRHKRQPITQCIDRCRFPTPDAAWSGRLCAGCGVRGTELGRYGGSRCRSSTDGGGKCLTHGRSEASTAAG